MDTLIYDISIKALYVSLIIAIAPVSAAMLVGFTVATFQTLMQVQEQSLPFFFKMLAVFGVMYLMSSWASAALLNFFDDVFKAMAAA